MLIVGINVCYVPLADIGSWSTKERAQNARHVDSVDRRENHIEQNVLLSWGNGESPSPSTIRNVASATV